MEVWVHQTNTHCGRNHSLCSQNTLAMICCGLNKMRCFILQCSTALCPSGFTCFILAVLRMSVKTFPVSTWSSCRNHIPVGNLVVQSGYFYFALSQCPFETTTFAFNVQLTVCHTGRPAFTGMLLINCVSLRGCLIVLCNFFLFFFAYCTISNTIYGFMTPI